MPTYEYACTECGERLEVVQRFSDDPLTVCEACGGKLRKVFSPVGIVFKGSGFYRTDSRNGGVPAGSKSGDGAEGSSKSDSNGSGDKSDSTSKSELGQVEFGRQFLVVGFLRLVEFVRRRFFGRRQRQRHVRIIKFR